jgi:hypothetical protein
LYVDGKVKQSDLVRVFGVSAISVKRAVKLYEEAGPGGFWRPRPTRGAAVLTSEVLRPSTDPNGPRSECGGSSRPTGSQI